MTFGKTRARAAGARSIAELLDVSHAVKDVMVLIPNLLDDRLTGYGTSEISVEILPRATIIGVGLEGACLVSEVAVALYMLWIFEPGQSWTCEFKHIPSVTGKHHEISKKHHEISQSQFSYPDWRCPRCKVPSTLLMSLLHVHALPWTWLVPTETLGKSGFTKVYFMSTSYPLT